MGKNRLVYCEWHHRLVDKTWKYQDFDGKWCNLCKKCYDWNIKFEKKIHKQEIWMMVIFIIIIVSIVINIIWQETR